MPVHKQAKSPTEPTLDPSQTTEQTFGAMHIIDAKNHA